MDTAKTRPHITRLTPLLWGYSVAAITLLLVEASAFVSDPIFTLTIPTMVWSRLPFAILFSLVICVGLSCPNLGIPRISSTVGNLIAVVIAAYSISALAGAALFGWADFVGRDSTLHLPKSFLDFLSRHSPFTPLGIGFWVAITPGALLALIGLLCAGYRRGLRRPFGPEFLILPILLASVACAAFVIGAACAERLSYTITLIDPADVGWPVLPVIALGSLSAWVAVKVTSHNRPRSSAIVNSEGGSLDKVISSASRAAVLILILLYLGISQTASYASRMAELVEARQALASDVLYGFFKDGRALNMTTNSSDGKLLRNWDILTTVPWADVTISQYPGDGKYIVEVERKMTREKWSARQYHQSFDTAMRRSRLPTDTEFPTRRLTMA
jgi:hypothetical protein